MPGKCGRCGLNVGAAEEKLALEKSWHLECFTCAICNKGLDSMTLAEYRELNEVYCKSCYRQFIGPQGYGYGPNGPTLIVYDKHENEEEDSTCTEIFMKPMKWTQPPTRLGKSFMRKKLALPYYAKNGSAKFQSRQGSKLVIGSPRIPETCKATLKFSQNSQHILNSIVAARSHSGNGTPVLKSQVSFQKTPPPSPPLPTIKSSGSGNNQRSSPVISSANSGNRSPRQISSSNSNGRTIPPPPPPPSIKSSGSRNNQRSTPVSPVNSGNGSPRQISSSNSNGQNRTVPPPPPPPSIKSSGSRNNQRSTPVSPANSGNGSPRQISSSNSNVQNRTIPPPPPPPLPPSIKPSSSRSIRRSTPVFPANSGNGSPRQISSSNSNGHNRTIPSPPSIKPSGSTNNQRSTPVSPINSGNRSPSQSPRSRSPSTRIANTQSVVNGQIPSQLDDTQLSLDPNCPPLFYCGRNCVGSIPRYPPNSPDSRRMALGPDFGAVRTVPKGLGEPCRRCGRPVYLAELQLGYHGAYHTECFKCCACGKKLDSTTVSEHQGEIFCKGCYRRNFATAGVGFGIGAGALQTP